MTDLCKQIYSDAYIVVKGTIGRLHGDENENNKSEKNAAFKINVRFISCISKINST